MNFVLYPNLSKEFAIQTAKRTADFLHGRGASVCIGASFSEPFRNVAGLRILPDDTLPTDTDFVIAIGGDGTILRCAGVILDDAARRNVHPFKLVGINTGTLGFLAAFEATELHMLDLLMAGNYSISSRMLLQTTITGGEQDAQVFHSLNDIYASRMNGRICDFSVAVDGQQIGVFRADGIVFSTPTGSSAYALSAGGPVIEPGLLLIEMNLICPHSLFARPMLFSPHRSISVTYCGVGDGGLNVHADGTHAAVLHNMQSFTVTKSPRVMPFVNCKGITFYDALNGKLMRPLKDFPMHNIPTAKMPGGEPVR